MEQKSTNVSASATTFEGQDFGETECSICLDLMIDPVQTNCDHIFCKICLVKVLTKGIWKICPLCRGKVTKVTEQKELKFHIENQLVGQLGEEEKEGRLEILAIRKVSEENISELGDTNQFFEQFLVMDKLVHPDGTIYHYIRNDQGKLVGIIYATTEYIHIASFKGLQNLEH